MKTITLIPGDGIGLEIVQAVRTVFSAAEVPLQWEELNAGTTTLEETGQLIPDELLQSINRNKIALKGPIGTPVGKGFRGVNVTLRQEYDLYANIRPVRNMPGVETRFQDVDIVLFRENIEDLYTGLEIYDEQLGIADAIKRNTKEACERIIQKAFEYAQQEGRSKVAVLHKANILKKTEGLFLETGREVAKQYPEIELQEYIIDNAFMQLVMRPEQFDVLVCTNMFGDLVSDLLAGLVGGLGVTPGANIGSRYAIFEAVHGTAPDIAGKDIANPSSLLLSSIMMLRYMGYVREANRIETALFRTLQQQDHRTPDLGGLASTQQFAQHISDELTQIEKKNPTPTA